MRLIYFLFFLFLTTCVINAQSNYYYYYKDEKINLKLYKKSFYLFTNSNFNSSSTNDLGIKEFNLITDDTVPDKKFAYIELKDEIKNEEEYYQKLDRLRSLPNVNNVGIFFENGTSTPIGISKYLYVKLKKDNDYIVLQQIGVEKGFHIVKPIPYMPKWYILAIDSGNFKSSLDLSNEIHEIGLFEDIDPAFMFKFSNGHTKDNPNYSNIIPDNNGENDDVTCSYDADFYRLWGLRNTSNSNHDINICEAWKISVGANVNIAVVDQGIYTSHPDLEIIDNGFDAQSGTSPSVYISGNTHGTKVAGVIGAIKNNLQVVGVAPFSNIIPVSHDLLSDQNPTINSSTSTSISAQLASGVSWAWQQGMADVINNSWGSSGEGIGSQLYSSVLEDALNNAMTLGRNGKGCVVIFSAGNSLNNNPVSVFYPANFDNRIITVGAMTKLGQRRYTSAFGSKLDVVAPGDMIWTTTNTDGIITANQTSIAAPHVSGIAALMLSINPCLTNLEVSDIIEQTSQKIGSYTYVNYSERPNGTWNNEMGYGLVDAHAAVLLAKSMIDLNNPCGEGKVELSEEIELKGLKYIAPNPVSDEIIINYKLNNAHSASLVLISLNGNGFSQNHNLELNSQQIKINLNNFSKGLYKVALIVDGQLSDSKTIIKK